MTTSTRPPLGADTWIWVSPVTDADLVVLAPRLAAWGFDVIELPVEDPGDWDPARTARLLGDVGLGATVCAVMPPGRELVAAEPSVVASTQDYLRRCVDAAAAVGSAVVAGPMYASVGRTWRPAPGERDRLRGELVRALAPVGRARRRLRRAVGHRAPQPLRDQRREHGRPGPRDGRGPATRGAWAWRSTPTTSTSRSRTRPPPPAPRATPVGSPTCRCAPTTGAPPAPTTSTGRRSACARRRRLRRSPVHRVLHGRERVDRHGRLDLAAAGPLAGCDRHRRPGLPAVALALRPCPRGAGQRCRGSARPLSHRFRRCASAC